MRELTIEWRHYDKDGATCLRCSATGKTLHEVVSELRKELASQKIQVIFTETMLREEQIPESNMILFNSIPMEELINEVQVSENSCPSCSCLSGSETSCRTMEYEGKTYEEIPEELIRIAAGKALWVNRR